MEPAVLVSAFALGVSAVGFFYKIGQDTRSKPPCENGEDKLDQIYRTTETINKKLDDIAEWQRKAAEIHASHEERIKTLFNRVELVEHRMEDREVMTAALQKILERVG